MADNVASTLCYVLGLITGILFLVLEPYNKNRVVRFHAFQSIFLNVAWFAFWIVIQIVASVFLTISFRLMMLVGLLSTLVGLAMLVLWVFLMVRAYQGQKLVLPIIGPLAERQA